MAITREVRWKRFDAAIKDCPACGQSHDRIRFAKTYVKMRSNNFSEWTGVCHSTGKEIKFNSKNVVRLHND